MSRRNLTVVLCALLAGACLAPGAPGAPALHSSTLALSADGNILYVANADADSVSVIDVTHQTLLREILLEGAHPVVSSSGAYVPAAMPRSLALSPDGWTLYVTGERSGSLYAVSLATDTVVRTIPVGSEPIGVLVSPDGGSVYVASSQDATIVRVDTRTLTVAGSVNVGPKPWALALSADGAQLFATHFLGAEVSSLQTADFSLATAFPVPSTAPRGDPRLAHGVVRALYDIAPRPGTDELWVAHMLLGIDNSQPTLDFESTAFPSLSILHSDGGYEETLSINAQDVPGVNGAFADVVSGPHAIAFTGDGNFVLLVDANSEDVMLVDARSRTEIGLVRPLPGRQPEGIVLSPDGKWAYVDERNSGDVAVLQLDASGGTLQASVFGSAIPRFVDPMPPVLRLGQHLFYSANSDQYPITRNHWVACATCHPEGRSDAVTWRFAQGPRDTPSNAGGMFNTGFLFRTADRSFVQDYWRTINLEQGGDFDPHDALQKQLLDALASYVNDAIPLPRPPTTNPTLVAAGQVIFNDPAVGCSDCHDGPRHTDSGTDNPTLDLAGPVMLHDVGTCVTTGYPDVAHEDIDGDPRAACMFDTPSLSGVADSAPYLHDGSAATLADVLAKTEGTMGNTSSLTAADKTALIEFLRSL